MVTGSIARDVLIDYARYFFGDSRRGARGGWPARAGEELGRPARDERKRRRHADALAAARTRAAVARGHQLALADAPVSRATTMPIRVIA